jgi:hypothetical protein
MEGQMNETLFRCPRCRGAGRMLFSVVLGPIPGSFFKTCSLCDGAGELTGKMLRERLTPEEARHFFVWGKTEESMAPKQDRAQSLFNTIHAAVTGLRDLAEYEEDETAVDLVEKMELCFYGPMRKLRYHWDVPYDGRGTLKEKEDD